MSQVLEWQTEKHNADGRGVGDVFSGARQDDTVSWVIVDRSGDIDRHKGLRRPQYQMAGMVSHSPLCPQGPAKGLARCGCHKY